MIIRCTKKLLRELKRTPENEATLGASSWSWHANVFYIERRKCVLVTHDETLLTMFMPALKSADFSAFHAVFGQNLFKTLLSEGIPQDQIEAVLRRCETLQYGKTNNRSVLGCMNDQTFQIRYMVQAEGGLARADKYMINNRINRNILSPTGYRYPIELFKEKLNSNG